MALVALSSIFKPLIITSIIVTIGLGVCLLFIDRSITPIRFWISLGLFLSLIIAGIIGALWFFLG